MQHAPTLPPLDSQHQFMHFRRIMFLRGPNIWSRRQCVEVWVDLGDFKELSSELLPGFNERYKAWLPSIIEHRCSEGERGGFFKRLDRGTYLAHILEHTTLELQTLSGCDVGFGRAREMSEEGVYKVAIRYEEESVVSESLRVAREILKACIYDLPFDVDSEVQRLRDLADRRCLGPSTKAIVNAAVDRNIPFRRLNAGSLVLLGHGIKQRRIWTAETDRTGAIAESIAQDKDLTKKLLSAVGVPVPEGRSVTDPEDAVEAAKEIESPVVVKPLDANHGRGIVPNLTQADEIRHAYHVAANEGTGVLVERFIAGFEHRLLVVGNKFIAACRGEPVTVAGDGQRNVSQLVLEVVNADPRRGVEETLPLCRVSIDESLRMILEHQGLTLESVPAVGKKVLIKRHDNLSNDVTDSVHPSVAENAVLAARTVGLDIAGVDIVALDISCPLEDQGGAVVEVNAGPGLIMHLKPLVGEPRPVGQAIVDQMFGPSGNARIPVVCVTGTSGKSKVVRFISQTLAKTGIVVGSAEYDGLYVSGRKIQTSRSDNAAGTKNLLINPLVEAAVIEAGSDGILREGLGVDKCDVAIVTRVEVENNLGGEFDLYDESKLFGVKRTPVDVVLENGTAVLNAADTLCLDMKPLSKGDVILFAIDPNLPSIKKHLEEGKRAVVCQDGNIVLNHAGSTTNVVALSDLQDLPKSDLELLTAGIAALWHLGVDLSIVREQSQTFGSIEASNT